jgi:hypothetical protein
MKEAARSTVNRPDSTASTQILSPELSEELGITAYLTHRYGIDAATDILGPDLPEGHSLFPVQQELRRLFTTTHTLPKTSDFNGTSYIDDTGRVVHINAAIAAGTDGTSPAVPGSRIVETNGARIYTGRITTRAHLEEQARRIIANTENLQPGPIHIAITSLLNTVGSEKDLLAAEAALCQPFQMDGGYTIIPHLFSSKPNASERLDRAVATLTPSIQSTSSLRAYVATCTLTPDERTIVDNCFRLLENPSLLPEEAIFLRDLICKTAKIPIIYHCKHSKDRTTYAGTAISAAIQKWIALGKLTGNPFYDIPENPLSILQMEQFKELVLLELPAAHQLSEYSLCANGSICGEELPHRQKGFMFYGHGHGIDWWVQPDILTRILPARLVERASLFKVALQAVAVALVALPILIWNIGVALYKTFFSRVDVKQAWMSILTLSSFNLIKTHQLKTELWTGEGPASLSHDPLKAFYGDSDLVARINALSKDDVQRVVGHLSNEALDLTAIPEGDLSILLEIHDRQFDQLDMKNLYPSLRTRNMKAILKAFQERISPFQNLPLIRALQKINDLSKEDLGVITTQLEDQKPPRDCTQAELIQTLVDHFPPLKDLGGACPSIQTRNVRDLFNALKTYIPYIKRHLPSLWTRASMRDFIETEVNTSPSIPEKASQRLTHTYPEGTVVSHQVDIDLLRGSTDKTFTIQDSVIELPSNNVRTIDRLNGTDKEALKEFWSAILLAELKKLPAFQSAEIPLFVLELFSQTPLNDCSGIYQASLANTWGNSFLITDVQNRRHRLSSTDATSLKLEVLFDFELLIADSRRIKPAKGEAAVEFQFRLEDGVWKQEVSVPNTPLNLVFTTSHIDSGADPA